jgi:maltose alpha-D-glucosyltransferase/alpha-amylase
MQPPEAVPLWTLVEQPPAAPVPDLIGAYLATADLIGERTAELHQVLAGDADHPSFAPEPFTPYYQRGLYQSMRSAVRLAFRSLRRQLHDLDPSLRGPAEQVLACESEILRRQQAVRSEPIAAQRIRCHGQYHLGKLLFTGRDFVVTDFRGDPALPLGERRIKRSPLRDIASMICSFHQVETRQPALAAAVRPGTTAAAAGRLPPGYGGPPHPGRPVPGEPGIAGVV